MAALALSATHVLAQAVSPAPAAAATSSTTGDVVKLEEFKVTDQQDAYKGNTAITGTKTDVPLIDVPAPIQVITKELIEDFGAVDITDLYPLMGSVTEFSYGGVSMRGFRMTPDPTRYNGIAGNPYNDFDVATLHNVEQVEVLKGPVGLLYGDNEPGGMMNIVTAKPKAKFGGSVRLNLGSFKMKGGSATVTGPIDAQKRFLYLFSATYLDRQTFRNNYEQRKLNLTGSLTWVIAEATRLNVEIEDITNEQPGARIRGVPFLTLTPAGTLAPANTPGGRFMAPISHAATEPTDFQNLWTTIYNVRLDHAFSSTWRINGFFRWYESRAHQAYHEGNLLVAPAFRLQQREFRHQLRENEESSWAINSISDHDLFRTKHKLLAGVEWSKVNRVFTQRTVPPAQIPTLDVVSPVYGRSSRNMYPTSLAGIAPNDTDKIRLGYYLQDQISLSDRWRVTAGLRLEDFNDKRRSPTSDEFQDDVLTYRGALGYKVQPNILAYYSYAMGLKPQSLGSEDQHGPFPPQESDSHEVGLKWDAFNNRLNVTTSVYDMRKTNILERDPTPGVPSNWLAPVGEVTSRGFELDVSGQATEAWMISANYAYNDTKVTKAGVFGTAIGSKFPNAPRHKWGVWTRYNFARPKIGVALGASYVGERRNFTAAQDFPGPAYTIYNAAVYYQWKKTQFSLKCENVFDKVYSKSVLGGEGHFPGTPRNYTFSAIYRF